MHAAAKTMRGGLVIQYGEITNLAGRKQHFFFSRWGGVCPQTTPTAMVGLAKPRTVYVCARTAVRICVCCCAP